MNRRLISTLLSLLLVLALLTGCSQPAAAPVAAAPQTEAPAAEPTEEPPVTLLVAGGWPDFRALDVLAQAFKAQYPNCNIEYEFLQDYYHSLERRLSGDEPVDLFLTTNIQSDSPLLPYAQDLFACEGLDLSNTFPGLIDNFTFRGAEGEAAKLYAIPMGAEMRGLYVNKTLLASVGLEVPTNQAELLAACQTLKEAGYIPFHGNPANFAQLLVYPWICNLVANAEDPQAVYAQVDAHQAGVSEVFRAPLEFLYNLMANGYYDYKTAQTDLGLYVDTTDDAYARYFLNIQQKDDAWAKADDLGQVAFMPSTISMDSVISRFKEDYHSEIEYVFIPAPIAPEGGFVYLSPAHGIAANKNSANLEWAVRLLDFLYQPENNVVFSQAFHTIPNTKEAFAYISERFDVPDNVISELGQVTFSYGFYGIVQASIVDISKGNNPKYMQDDGAGNLTLYPLSYYMEALDAALVAAQ